MQKQTIDGSPLLPFGTVEALFTPGGPGDLLPNFVSGYPGGNRVPVAFRKWGVHHQQKGI
jgi:hypothetical protein